MTSSSKQLISGLYNSSIQSYTDLFKGYITSCVSSSSAKLKVVAATRVDGCFGDDAAKTGESGCTLAHNGRLLVKCGGISYITTFYSELFQCPLLLLNKPSLLKQVGNFISVLHMFAPINLDSG